MADIFSALQAAAGASTGEKFWLSTITGTSTSGSNYIQDSTVDDSGNVYVCGSIYDTGNARTTIYLAKYDKSGVLIDQRYATSNTGSSVSNIRLDSSGNIYFLVSLYSIWKLNSSFVFQWRKNPNTGGIRKFTFKSNGNIIGLATPSGRITIVEINSSTGALISSSSSQVSGSSPFVSQIINDMDVTPNGSIVICGDGILSAGTSRGYALGANSSYSSISGSRAYLHSWQTTLSTCAASPVNNVWYAAGWEQSSTSPYTFSTFLVKMNTSCGAFWTKVYKDSTSAVTSPLQLSLAVDSSDNVYMYYRHNPSGVTVGQIIKFDSNGNELWQRRISRTGGNFIPYKISLTNDENILFVGEASGVLRMATIQASGDGDGTGTYSNNSYTYVYATSSVGTTSLQSSISSQGQVFSAFTFTLSDGTTPTLASISRTYETTPLT